MTDFPIVSYKPIDAFPGIGAAMHYRRNRDIREQQGTIDIIPNEESERMLLRRSFSEGLFYSVHGASLLVTTVGAYAGFWIVCDKLL